MNEYYAFSDSYECCSPTEVPIVRLGKNTFSLGGKVGEFVIDEECISNIINEFKNRSRDIVIDWDHATMDKSLAGKGDAPAAGWVDDLYVKDNTLYAKIKCWTEKAKKAFSDKTYKYLSPVMLFSQTTKKPFSLHSIGLTNHPAIWGQPAIIAANDFNDFFKDIKQNTDSEPVELKSLKETILETKQSINALSKGLIENINLFAEIAEKYQLGEEYVSAFTDSLFSEDLQEFSKVAQPAKIVVLNDFSERVAAETYGMSGEEYLNWLSERIKEYNALLEVGLADKEKERDIRESLKLAQDEYNKMIANKEAFSDLWEAGYRQFDEATLKKFNDEKIATMQFNDIVLDGDEAINSMANIIALKISSNKSPEEVAQKLVDMIISLPIADLVLKKISELTPQKQNVAEEGAKNAQTETVENIPNEEQKLTINFAKLLSFNDLGLPETSTIDDVKERITKITKEIKHINSVLNAVGIKDINTLPQFIKKLNSDIKRIKAENIVDKYLNSPDCKLPISQREWAIQFAMNDLEGFKKHIEGAPIIFSDINFSQKLDKKGNKQYSEIQRKIAQACGHACEEVYE